jgi:thioredoxin 1
MVKDMNKNMFIEKIFDYEKNNEWIYRGELPSVIDFWAPWCGPCRAVSPAIEELSEEYAGKVNFYKINTDEEAELSAAFDIKSIPSILFIPMKGQPKMAIGAHPKEVIKQAIDAELIQQDSSLNMN